MSRFTTHGAISAVETEAGWAWILSSPLVWEVGDAAGEIADEIEVPLGFFTDLGTIPSFGRWLFNPADPQCAQAFILHDWLLIQWGPERQIEAAGVLYQALRALAVRKWQRIIIVLAVIAGIDRW